jgi:hypothetical protein
VTCQCTSSAEGRRRGRSISGRNATIHKSPNVNRSVTKCNGDQYECTEFYKGEKTHNHHGQGHTFGQKYSHPKS